MKDKAVPLLKAVVLILAGVIFLVNPGGSLLSVVKIFGAALLAYGIFTAVSQLLARDEKQPGALTAGLIAVAVGIVVFIAPAFVVSLFPVVAGVIVIIGGAKRFWDALAAKNAGDRDWPLGLALSLVCVALGVLVVVNPFGTALGFVKLIGIAGIYYGATALVRLLKK